MRGLAWLIRNGVVLLLFISGCASRYPQDVRVESVLKVDRDNLVPWDRLISQGYADRTGLAIVLSASDMPSAVVDRDRLFIIVNTSFCDGERADSVLRSDVIYDWTPMAHNDSGRFFRAAIVDVRGESFTFERQSRNFNFDLSKTPEDLCLVVPGTAFSFDHSNTVRVKAAQISEALAKPVLQLPKLRNLTSW